MTNRYGNYTMTTFNTNTTTKKTKIDIYANEANQLNITNTGYLSFAGNTIWAPKHGSFNMISDGEEATYANKFNFQNGTSAKLSCTGYKACYLNLLFGYTMRGPLTIIGNGVQALYYLWVYCPNNGRKGDLTCNIIGETSITQNVISQVKVYAVEGLTDAYYTCRTPHTTIENNVSITSYTYNDYECFYNTSMYCGRWWNFSAKEYQVFKKDERCLLYYNGTTIDTVTANGTVSEDIEWACTPKKVLNTSSDYCNDFIIDGDDDTTDNSASALFYKLFYNDIFAWFLAGFIFCMGGINFLLFCYAIWRTQGEDEKDNSQKNKNKKKNKK